MGQAIVWLITIGLMIYALVDCWRSEDHEVRSLPRPVWFLVALVPLAGAIAWLVYGAPRSTGTRPNRSSSGTPARRPAVMATVNTPNISAP